MRAVEIGPERRLVVVDRPEEAMGEGEVRVQVALCGICGSDIHMRPADMVPLGTVMGHELSGRIVDAGPDVGDWSVGQRVVINPFDPCGTCAQCARGDSHLCMNPAGRQIGLITRAGGYAESVVAKPHQLFAIPDEVSDEGGALVEPLAVGIHGVSLHPPEPGDAVAVFGAGPIGLMTLLALRARGAERIVLVERNPSRGRRVGEVVDVPTITPDDVEAGRLPDLLGDPPDVVFDCAGHSSVMPMAMAQVRPAGTIVMVGIADDPTPIIPGVLAMKEITIKGALAYRRADFDEAIRLLAAGDIPVERIVTTVAKLEQAEDMFQELVRPGTEQLKILLSPTA